MAINPHNRYPGQTAAPSPAYPYGNARNQTVPGDRRGTPLERTWVSDLWGFFQAILTEAGITPSGTPDAANNSQYLSGLKKILSLQNLFDRTAADQGTPGSAQLEGKLLQIVDSVRSDIIAGDVEGAYARLRGEENLSHVVASAVEDEVYAALTSWLDTERARLSLRGTLREILGRDMAGDGAPISVPNGLNVGTSFMPPAGYLPGAPATYLTAGTYEFSPSGCRAVMFECLGGGGGSNDTDTGGGGGYLRGFKILADQSDLPVVVGEGGAPAPGGGGTAGDGGSSYIGTGTATNFGIAHGGKGGSGVGPGEGGTASIVLSMALCVAAGEAGVGDLSTRRGGHVAIAPFGGFRGGGADVSRKKGQDGLVIITPLF